MNTLDQIKRFIEQISSIEQSIYLDAIRLHLERAEVYYLQGNTDSAFYTDVIYRTNQAYEGSLKEAYKVLANKTDEEVKKEKPYKIETYFETNSVFKERVLELFRNYRNEWRNKSTHDYKLFFDDSEAFIALSNVNSFVYLLLKQILERIAFKHEQNQIEQSTERQEKIASLTKLKTNLLDFISSILLDFLVIHNFDLGTKKYENEISGMLNGYLSAFKVLQVYEQPKLAKGVNPDFIIEGQRGKIIIEIKRFLTIINIEPAINQLVTYLKHADLKVGILLAISSKPECEKPEFEDREVKIDDRSFKIRIIKN